MTNKTLSIETYKHTEAGCDPERKFLALVFTKGAALSVWGKTKKEAQERAESWLAEERAKAAKPPRPSTARKGTPLTAETDQP